MSDSPETPEQRSRRLLKKYTENRAKEVKQENVVGNVLLVILFVVVVLDGILYFFIPEASWVYWLGVALQS